MTQIRVLEQDTIDKIAAGEVIERPSSIVKELTENAIDAGANAITVEIREGGISFIRITDNGEGIDKSQVSSAFLRHATSKIRCVEDLQHIGSLGFRGEALSSIAAVSQVELITKTAGNLTGIRYLIEGGREKGLEEIGAPEGSTFLIRNVFYNTPARKKFLKSAATEAGYISDLLEHLALSHPEISFKFINNGQTRLHTSGNRNLRDIIYGIYGRDIAANLIEINADRDGMHLSGFIGKPLISRGNRNYENYFVNGRYVKSSVISRAIEEGYKSFMMQHRYPFTVLRFEIDGSMMDINVHPTKMELRFADGSAVYQFVCDVVKYALSHRELIPRMTLGKEETEKKQGADRKISYPEPFECARISHMAETKNSYGTVPVLKPHVSEEVMQKTVQESLQCLRDHPTAGVSKTAQPVPAESRKLPDGASKQSEEGRRNERPLSADGQENNRPACQGKENPAGDGLGEVEAAGDREPRISGRKAEEYQKEIPADGERLSQKQEATGKVQDGKPQQMELFDEKLLSRESVPEHRLIGQIFDTYWIVQFRDSLYIIDQHAAHEKVMYERLTRSLKTKEFTTQRMSPPVILTLSMQEENLLKKYENYFSEIGFEIEPFGGREYAICGVPGNFFGLADRELFVEMLDSLSESTGQPSIDLLNEKLATMACKSAVKGNNRLSVSEANALIQELLGLENPYNCPHGRPTIISMSKYELEKKFKRIV